ncbi:MAG: hypothetical protein NXI10_16990 [bacterium]|nr:hypothetical protein [bacterium]
MKSIYTLALVLLMGSALGQSQKDLSIQYHPDGGKTVIDHDGEEIVTLKFNKDGLCTFREVQIVGSQRVLRNEYVYDHEHRLVEDIDYNFSEGYDKTVTVFNAKGLEASVTTYESASKHKKGNWLIVAQRNYEYDHLNRVVRFESKRVSGRTNYQHMHMIDEITHNADGSTTTLEKELDASGRVVKSGRSRSMGRLPVEVKKHSIVQSKSSTANGFMIVSATGGLKNETYYENNRIVQEKFYRAKSNWHDLERAVYELWYTFDFQYQNGKLVSQTVFDKDELKSKRLIEYEGDRPVRFKRFYKQSNGSMKMVVKQGFTPAHEPYFPKLTSDYRPGDNLSAFGDGTDEPLNEVNGQEPYEAHDSPAYNFDSKEGIVQELEKTPKFPLSGVSVTLDKETQALLDQIKMLANSNSTEHITEAQILHLALQQLVDQHREELKELNQKYLDSQQSMFD